MEWYTDLVAIPMGLAILMSYHVFLYYKVTRHPYQTSIGINHEGRRLWVHFMAKDNEKKQILVVQSIRNSIMESSVMATTAILLSAGLGAYMTYTYGVKRPLDLGGGGSNAVPESVKLMGVLSFFLLSFLCQTHSISLINQVNYLVNVPMDDVAKMVPLSYICGVMEKSSVYCIVGCRLFYIGLALLFWVFGSIPAFLGLLFLLHHMYTLDFIKQDPQLQPSIQFDLEAAK